MSHPVVLSVNCLSKCYKGLDNSVQALQDVSFELYQGELLAIMGTSGSGKSTLLNILGALDAPDKGSISIEGSVVEGIFEEPEATKYRAKHIGFIFQSYHLLKDLSVEENLALPLILRSMEQQEIKDKVSRMLSMLGLIKWKHHRPVQLSGGQQQRVAIGRALITSPPILLADEPTGNLDYNTSKDILDVLVEMKTTLSQSIILVTHDPAVAAYAERVLFFHDGRVVDEYTCQQSLEDMPSIIHKFQALLEGSL